MKDYIDSYKIGLWEEYNFRFLLTDCTSTFQEVVRRQKLKYSSAVMVAKTMLGAFFLAGMVKEDTIVSIQLEGDGPIERVMGYSDRIGRMRGLARYPDILSENESTLGIGKGIFRVTRWGGSRKLHQSITKMEKVGFENNLLNHISESDQLVSFLSIHIGKDFSCKGMIMQALPYTPQVKIDELMDRLREISYSTEELFSGDLESTLAKLEDTLKSNALTLDAGIPEFYCGCSIEKIKNVIRSMGKDESYSILEEQGKIEITCEFCNEIYELDSEEVRLLFI
jgi:molecular chaperone Hsp33